MIELPIRVGAPDVSHIDALANGTRLGEFEVCGLIGVGGFGMVYRAYDHSLQRDVAIKEYLPTALARRADSGLSISIRASNDAETFQAGLRSFVGEARMLAKFEHPSLVRVFRFWEANDTAYMVMPLYRGMTLKQARQTMRLPPTEAWLRKVLWSVLGALKVLHRGNALHRDVSPDNIFLQDSGPPVLLDLGAARFAISDSSRQHTAILKIHYAPIEQYADAHGLPQGPWTDLYALAAVVHGLLRNEAPLPAMVRVVNDTLPAFGNIVKTVASEFGQSYSDPFVNGIAWALQIQPQDRPQSVREFVRALEIVTPNGMSTFDWRADLGPTALPAGDLLPLPGARTTEDKTRPNHTNPDYAATQFIDADADTDRDDIDNPVTVIADWGSGVTPAALPDASADHHSRPRAPMVRPVVADSASTAVRRKAGSRTTPTAQARQLPNLRWAWVGLLVLSMLAVAAWGWRSWSGKDRVATRATASLQALPQGTSTPAAPATSLADMPPANATREPIETIIESSTPARPSATSSAPTDTTNKANERTRKATAKPAKADPLRTPMTTETTGTPPMVALATSTPEPKPTAPVATPETLCKDTNFLTRSMCLYRACQSPSLSATATCIELQKTLQRSTETNESSRF